MLYDFTSFESDFTCLEVRVWVTFDGTQNKVLISNFHHVLHIMEYGIVGISSL